MRNPLSSKTTMSLAKLILFGCSVCLIQNGLVAQNNYIPNDVGSVIFKLGGTSIPPSHAQTVSLYGCNTRITIDGKNWHKSDSLEWNKANQVLDSVPFGPQNENKKDSFYISKYYIAAPPVIKKPKFNIGKVIPDNFSFDSKNPIQHVRFHYTRVIETYVKPVPVSFATSYKNTGISILPINIECSDFPWLDSTKASDIGASGIGDLQFSSSANFSGLFLPYYFKKMQTDTTFLNCEITILNDIIPHHQIEFEINGDSTSRSSTINLMRHRNDSITVVCSGPKTVLPCGCRKPSKAQPCD